VIDLSDLVSAAFRFWTPLGFAAMGGVVSERAGVVNIGLEAMMLGGAFAGVAVASTSGNAYLGLAAGTATGALIGFLHAVLTQALRVPHILSGVGLNLGILGLTTYLLRVYFGGALDTENKLPGLFVTLLGIVTVLTLFFILARTPLGLRLRAVGENPAAARSAGVNVTRLRYSAVTLSGALAGIGGVALALAALGSFRENMTGGRGYIALAAVIFGRWHPLGAAAAAFFFALGDALQQSLQTAGLAERIPPDFLTLLPYLLTLIALAGLSGKASAPAALGNQEA
jgi:Uncharacterized ABC-type transport system, permease component